MRELSTIVWSHHHRGVRTPHSKLKSQIDDIRFATVVSAAVAALPELYFNVYVISYYLGEVKPYETRQKSLFEIASAF